MQPLWEGVQERGSYRLAHLPLTGSSAFRHWFTSCAFRDDGAYPTTGLQAVQSPGCNTTESRSWQPNTVHSKASAHRRPHMSCSTTLTCLYLMSALRSNLCSYSRGTSPKEAKGASNCFTQSKVHLLTVLEEQLIHRSLITGYCSQSLTFSWALQGQRRPKLLQI